MLKKYLWQFLGALLALGAIFATYDVYIRSRPVKELQVILNSALPVVGGKIQIAGNMQVASNLQLTLNNNVISDAVIYQVTVKNIGNQPIVESDYSKPLAFRFNPKDEILEVFTASTPANIGMNIQRTSAYQAEADPALLNPGDTVSINFIVTISESTSLVDHFHVDGRIVGVKTIDLITSPKTVPASLKLRDRTIFSIMGVLAGIGSSLAYERLLGSLRKSAQLGKAV